MADISRTVQMTLGPTATANENFQPIPAGKSVVIRRFGFADPNNGDNKSTTFVLRFGNEIVRVGTATGSAIDLAVNKSFIGDGVKSFRVTAVNGSLIGKTVAIWLDLFLD